MNNELNQITGVFNLPNAPLWVHEMFSHPILFILALATILLGFIELKKKLSEGSIRVNDQVANIIAFVGILLMAIIATR